MSCHESSAIAEFILVNRIHYKIIFVHLYHELLHWLQNRLDRESISLNFFLETALPLFVHSRQTQYHCQDSHSYSWQRAMSWATDPVTIQYPSTANLLDTLLNSERPYLPPHQSLSPTPDKLLMMSYTGYILKGVHWVVQLKAWTTLGVDRGQSRNSVSRLSPVARCVLGFQGVFTRGHKTRLFWSLSVL